MAVKFGEQRMTRLITFGCSFTKYNWPTWADILGREYAFFHNWGYPGIGNRAIVERLAEAHTLHDICKDDTIIIQWSSHVRHDYARLDSPNNAESSMWKTKGNIFTEHNSDVFDSKWIKNFWNEKTYYIHTLNSILLAQEFLNSTGCKWYMTSMNDLENPHDLGYNYNENEPGKTFDVWGRSPDLIPYKEKIWDKFRYKWLPNLLQEKHDTPNLDWWFCRDVNSISLKILKTKGNKFKEPHLTYRQHYNYLLKNKIHDLLGISNTSAISIEADLDLYDNMNKQSKDYPDFISKISNTLWGMTTRSRGR